MRTRALVFLASAAGACAVLAPFATAGSVHTQITKWEIETLHSHKKTVHSGAKVTFCAGDPYYGLSPFFTWSGVPSGALMTLTVSAPHLKTASSKTKTFEASGLNADTINAMEYGVSAKSLPPGTYTLRVAVAGSEASGSISLVEKPNC